MKLLFKQRFFSWFDSYDIYDEAGNTVYTVKGQLSWGHRLNIYDQTGRHLGTVQQKFFAFLPSFEFYEGENYLGRLKKNFTFFKPSYEIDFNGWSVRGNFMEWDYDIKDPHGYRVAQINKEIFHLTDTYCIDVADACNALYALMVVLAIDAEKCSRN